LEAYPRQNGARSASDGDAKSSKQREKERDLLNWSTRRVLREISMREGYLLVQVTQEEEMNLDTIIDIKMRH
jgi:hypothetical protein